MKCQHCKTEITNDDYIITSPDGDIVHKNCYDDYLKEEMDFINSVLNDDDKLDPWL